MPIAPTYPGVYIEEVPSGARTIVGVATSITAFLGRAVRGPIDDPVRVSNFGEYERTFGSLVEYSTMSYAVRDFFLNGGTQALIVRLYHPSFKDADEKAAATAAANLVINAATGAASGEKALAAATTKSADINNDGNHNAAEKAAARDALKAIQAFHIDPQAVKDAARVKATSFNGDNDTKGPTDEVAKAAETATPTGPSPAKAARVKADTLKQGAVDKVKNALEDVAKAAETKEIELLKAAAGDLRKAAVPSTFVELKRENDTLSLRAANQGSWGRALRARVDYDIRDPKSDETPASLADLFNLTVTDGTTTEQFLNLSITKGHPRQVDMVLEKSALVRWLGGLPASKPKAHEAPAAGKDPFADDNPATVVTKPSNVASDGVAAEKEDYTGPGTRDGRKGLYALDKVDLFNILCLPPPKRDEDLPSDLYPEVLNYCQQKRAFFIIDSRADWEAPLTDFLSKNAPKEFLKLHLKIDSAKNGAIFFPRLKQRDPNRDGRLELFSPSGALAGIFARTDANRGVWKAPAGTEATLAGVDALAVELDDAQNGILNPLGINCIRVFSAQGIVSWGSRTLRGDDRQAETDWKYIPVRRLALFIEESLYRGTQFAVFEPNDEPLWTQLRLTIGAFMQDLFRQGAFQGRTPAEAYGVRCDKTTTTQHDIDLGRVNILVQFAPLKPAEFVVLRIQQLAGQSQA